MSPGALPGAREVGESRFVVWHVVVPEPLDDAVADRLAAALDPVDRARWLAAAAGRRAEYLVGRALLRVCLGTALGVEPASVPLVHNDDGKPLLAGDGESPVHANVSHSGPHVLVALTAEGPVGVDVEVVGPYPERVARRFFAPAEHELVVALPPDERDAAFYHLWTVKEACIKARGTGLRTPLAQVPASLAPSGVSGDAWWRTLPLGPGVAGAVAVVGDPSRAGAGPVLPLTVDALAAAVG